MNISYDLSESYHESQKMSFQASGIVKTADGREINFDMNIKMSYEYSQTNNISFRAGNGAIDPLIINIDKALTELTHDKYSFDINIDGTNENISMPGEGLGFLALDKNKDGAINDGSELFGAKTGDGFSELAAYDSDKNGWIDENDPIFAELKIMVQDNTSPNGTSLHSLKDEGVGAIYLGSVSTNYHIKGDNNETLGTIRKSGFYLREDGTTGTVQHIDLNV